MLIRELIEDDIELCISLFIEVFNQPPWNNEWTYEVTKQIFYDFWNTPSFKGYVAVDESQEKSIVATILGKEKQWWRGKEFLIEEFFVRTDMQGQGIGSDILDYACSDIKLRGIDNVILLTNTFAPAYSFYLNRDFKENQTLRLLYKKI
ncbi:GNAT family N-acetyltransferase [Paenibacillus methanolicus]|uniref:Ribosomal protein S18 acetylase RimI-like enzyme n=1 Tax=Paenibacillus methanolicus TaxID=582686 RepID=A0A5S5CFW2_9BACL|nr:GNAT family N-acetyltransferase [Paenibacillus methanolicus]TYP78274.1 ribosomal protein S18 acetylase RimI-like enzyme [Paenibacillus methanolicus]